MRTLVIRGPHTRRSSLVARIKPPLVGTTHYSLGMGLSKIFLEWPVVRQLRSGDSFGRGSAVTSKHTRAITARTTTADRVVQSVCPYCAVGCGQRVFVKDERVVQIEGDPDSPISRGRLCPKGSASEQLVNSPGRQLKMLYRAPRATEWQHLDLETAIDMVADRFIESRRHTWQDIDKKGQLLRRTMGIASLGGATLDNEENYLIKKLFTAAGAIQIENQARI
jgi:formate dehydrogenase major subunit